MQTLASPLSLINYRIHRLREGYIALIGVRSNAWCIIQEKDLDRIMDLIQTNDQDTVELFPPVLQALWHAGLLKINDRCFSDAAKKNDKTPSSLLLKLTGACNINCEYCYDYDHGRWKKALSFDKIKESIDYLVSKRPSFGIVFHGGEPLLRFDLIKQTVEYTLTKVDRRHVKFQIQTNGLLLDDKIINFLETHNFSVGLSLDGINEQTNSLRVTHNNRPTTDFFHRLLNTYPEFVKNRCGVLSVVSKNNIDSIPDLALWLQDKGVNNLSISFLDLTGKGKLMLDKKVSPKEAVQLFEKMIELIRKEKLWELSFTSLLSRISNLYQFVPKNFCHKGPCAASDDFLVLDAEGNFRTCDCIYDPFFFIGPDKNDILESQARANIIERHQWLETDGLQCHKCEFFSFCGGTCAAKAIAANNDPLSIDHIECAIAKYIFPELLDEYIFSESKPLFDYYNYHNP